MKFPRSYADLACAPWCDAIERPDADGGCFIHVRIDWLPRDHFVSNACSAHGDTLAEALEDLRSTLWPHIRPPIHLTLTNWEATWLKTLLKNPVFASPADPMPDEIKLDRETREAIFNALPLFSALDQAST